MSAEPVFEVIAPTPGKYLTFRLSGEFYGLDITYVQEILGRLSVTRVPRTPDYITGVSNLRGKVTPVLDMRLRLGVPAIDNPKVCVVVIQFEHEGRVRRPRSGC